MAVSSHSPSKSQLEEGRLRLEDQEKRANELQHKIEDAEHALEDLIAESTRAISALEEDKRRVESEIKATKEFLSPMRRLPDDLLRHIFLSDFEETPCCAWTLAVTTLSSSPETVRLWLERSGTRVPLDIEIYLHIPAPPKRRRRDGTPIPAYGSPPITDIFYHGPPTPNGWYVPPPPPPPINVVPLGLQNAIPNLPLPTAPQGHAVYIESTSHRRSSRNKNQSPASSSWGHIVMFYLAEQMHRWKRFVFRFDRQFDSMSALRNIACDAPLLEEFEVSCGEPLRSDADLYPYDWQWLPSTDREVALPNINSVSLQYVPFRWSSPLIAGNLRALSIRSLSTPGMGGHTSTQMTLDRLLHIISSNPLLEHLSLHFQNSQAAVLPLEATRLGELKYLSIGGAYTLAPLIDALITPSLQSLTLNIDREAPEESISALIARSNSPPISFLSLAYQSQLGMGPYIGDGPPGMTPWGFLASLSHVKTLQVGHTALDVLLEALAHVEEESGVWLAPELEHLALRSCHAHGDSVPKLVAFIEARNPPLPGTNANYIHGAGVGTAEPGHGPGVLLNPAPQNAFAGAVVLPPPPPHIAAGGTGHPTRLKVLELHECTQLGEDIAKWLKSRIPDVKLSEPLNGRCEVVPGIQSWPAYFSPA